jgi:predicted outer membrane protein
MSTKYTNLLDSIQAYSGHQFDSAFLNTVIDEHDQDIERFTTLSQRSTNPIFREILTNNLEILHRQKKEAEELKDNLNIED